MEVFRSGGNRPNGHWQPVPEAHVQAQLVGLHVVVVVS